MKKEIYRRNLPHYHIKGQTFFITWMLYGALPHKVLTNLYLDEEKERTIESGTDSSSEELKRDYRRNKFIHFDNYLDNVKSGKHTLRIPEVAKIVVDSLHFWDQNKIDLICYCIMSNHVHTIFSILEKDHNDGEVYLQDILESIKKFSARRCNRKLNRKGQFWQHESYDRLIKDREDLYWTLNYVLDNPVKAGFCKRREEYKWNYIKPAYKDFMECDYENNSD